MIKSEYQRVSPPHVVKKLRGKLLSTILALVLIFFFTPVNGQVGDYFIKIRGLGNNLPGYFQCNVSFDYTGAYIPGFYITSYDNSSETELCVIPGGSDLTINVDGAQHTFTPIIGVDEYFFYPEASAEIVITVFIYDVPNITRVELDNSFTIISEIAQNLPPSSILKLNYSSSVTESQYTTAISNSAWQTKPYSELFGPLDPCGVTFEFQFSLRISGISGEIYGTSYSATFKHVVGPVTINSVERKACSPYLTIIATVDPSIARNANRYGFNLLDNNGVYFYTFKNKSFNDNELTLSAISEDEGNYILGGNYWLHVEDNNSILCPRVVPVTIGAPVARLNISSASAITKTTVGGVNYHITKYGEAGGQAKVSLTSSANLSSIEIKESSWSNFQPYAYSASGNDFTLSGLTAGTYSVRCVDLNGCYSNEMTFTLVQPDPFSITGKTTVAAPCHPNNSVVSANKGSISFTINGGVPSYSVTINGIYSSSNNYGTVNIPNLSPRNYHVRVSNGYESSDFYMAVGAPSTAMTIVGSGTDISCNGGNNGSIVFTAYNNANPISTFELDPTGSTEEVLATNIRRYSGLGEGLYGAIVTDNKGCFAESNKIEISEPQTPLTVEVTGSQIREYGDNSGTLKIAINGGTEGYSYTLYKAGSPIASDNSTGTTTIGSLLAGEYSVVVTDSKGCIASSGTVSIVQPSAPLSLVTLGVTNATCFGGSNGGVTVEASGGWGDYHYRLNQGGYNNTGIFTGLFATVGNDTVYVVDAQGVTTGIRITITQPEEIVVESVTTYGLSCFNDNTGAIKLDIVGGIPGYWISADGVTWVEGDSLGNLDGGQDLVFHVRDANGCFTTQNASIHEPLEIDIDGQIKVVDAHCGLKDGRIEVDPHGGTQPYNYNWVDNETSASLGINSARVSNLKAGSYTLFLTDAHGCTASLSASLNDSDGPTIELNSIKDVACFGGNNGEISVNIEGGASLYEYTFSKLDGTLGGIPFKTDRTNDTATANYLTAGSYWLSAKDINKCMVYGHFRVAEPKELKVSGEVLEPGCHDSSDGFIALQVAGGNGGFSYLWSDSSTQKNLQFKGKGDYSVRVTDTLGCDAPASFTLTAPPPPVVQLDEIDLTICAGNSMVVDGGEHSAYKWSFNGQELSTDRYLSVHNMGYYVLEGFDQAGCSNKDSVMVMVSSTPLAAHFFLIDSAVIGETVEAIDVTWPVPDSIEWHFDRPVSEIGSTYWSDQFTIESPGTINVTLRAWYNGCYSDSTKSVVFLSDMEEKVGKKDVEPLILDMKAYPNPTDGNFRLALELERKSVLLITLYNSVGKVVESRKMDVDGFFELPYSLEGLMPGVYLLVVRGGYEQRQVRIVIR